MSTLLERVREKLVEEQATARGNAMTSMSEEAAARHAVHVLKGLLGELHEWKWGGTLSCMCGEIFDTQPLLLDHISG